MLRISLLALTLAATGFAAPAAAPEGYSAVYITSNVNTKFVIEPKTADSGAAIVVLVTHHTPYR